MDAFRGVLSREHQWGPTARHPSLLPNPSIEIKLPLVEPKISLDGALKKLICLGILTENMFFHKKTHIFGCPYRFV